MLLCLFTCSISRLTFRGRLSLSTTPRRKDRYLRGRDKQKDTAAMVIEALVHELHILMHALRPMQSNATQRAKLNVQAQQWN
jgi:hypothetical protein